MKRLLALVLALLMVLTSVFVLSGCSDEKGDKEKSGKKTETTQKNDDKQADSNIHFFDKGAEFKLGTPEKTLDPETVYSKINYEACMFFGDYSIRGGKDAEAKFAQDTALIDYKMSYSNQITAFPFEFEAGKYTMSSHVMGSIRGKNIMNAYFFTEDGNLVTNFCTFEVKNNKLVLNLVKEFEYFEEENKLEYVMSDTFLEYDFDFNGTELVLSNENGSVTLCSTLDFEGDYHVSTDSYAATDADKLDGIGYMTFFWSESDNQGSLYIGEDSIYDDAAVASLDDNGIITLTTTKEYGSKTYQFVYFMCQKDGIILTDGINTYHYTERSGSYFIDNVSVEDMSKLGGLSKEKLEEITQKKTDLLTDLAAAYKDAGLDVTINEKTGEINLDASVLFEVNKYDISKDGKNLLKKFMQTYTSVVYDDKYENFISKIMVEGHTDTTGDYESNLKLSQNRADSVKNFCLSKDCGVSAEYTDQLKKSLNAVGYSCDNPIYDKNGNIDMDASRRVSFRFIISLD